jgi:hypothetical protein
MNVPRASALMLTALAAGAGGRIYFDRSRTVACANHRQSRWFALAGLSATSPDKCLGLPTTDSALQWLDANGVRNAPDVQLRIASRNPAAIAAMPSGAPASSRQRLVTGHPLPG